MNLLKNLYMFIPETFRLKIKYGVIGIGIIFVLTLYLVYILGYMDGAQAYRIYAETLERTCICIK